MANDLISMCLECKRIRIWDKVWIDKTHPLYKTLLQGKNISDGYCPEHMSDNQLYNEFALRKEIVNKIEKALF